MGRSRLSFPPVYKIPTRNISLSCLLYIGSNKLEAVPISKANRLRKSTLTLTFDQCGDLGTSSSANGVARTNLGRVRKLRK